MRPKFSSFNSQIELEQTLTEPSPNKMQTARFISNPKPILCFC